MFDENENVIQHPVQQQGIIMDGQKKVKTIVNLVTYFKIDENIKDLFHYNEFSGYFEYAKDFNWPEHPEKKRKGDRIEESDFIHLKYYLAHNKKFDMTVQQNKDALTEYAARTRYHPVTEYLDALEWDGVPRLNSWLFNACGVEIDPYSQDIGRKWLVAAVTRIYQPGYKFDYVLVLEGKENIGKSLVLRTLGDPWFSDSISLQQKEADIVSKMVGNWIIEIAEMRGVSKVEQTFVKAFLSCQVDEQRFAYRENPKKYPRQSVFAGTSNNMSYLLDADGNRRFWPVECHKIDINWLRENRDQLFAEAKYIYEDGIYPINPDGERLFLTGQSLEISRKNQKQRLGVDEVMEEMVYKYLLDKNEVTMLEVLKNCFGFSDKDIAGRSQTILIGRILLKLGFEKKERSRSEGSRYIYIRMPIVSNEEHGIPASEVVLEEEE